MNMIELAQIFGLIALAIALIGSMYKFYQYLTRDKVLISLILKRVHKIKPLEGDIPGKTTYPQLIFEVSIVNDSKREISITRCYLRLDKKLKENKLFKGLYKQYFKFDDEDLRFEYKSLQGKNLPITLPPHFLCEVELGHHHLIEYLLSTDVSLVLVDQRRNKYTSNLVKIDPVKEV